MQIRIWNEQWARNMASVAKRQEKEERAWAKESKKQLAIDQTTELQKAIQDLDILLISSLEPDHTIDWSTLKDTSEFPAAQPVPPVLPSPPPEPKFGEPRFTPQLSWFTRLIPPVRQKAQAHALDLFNKAHQDWTRIVAESDRLGRTRAEEFKKARETWEQNKARWQEDQAKSNSTIDLAEKNYRSGKPESIAEYCEMVLHNSEYPESFPSDAVVAYVPETRTAVVEYSLPDISALPKLKEVKYVAAREAFQDVPVSETWLNRTYDSVLYQIALRSLHELFQADAVNVIDSIVLNGWVTSTDKAIGKQVTGCVLSVHATKSEFMDINLDQVEPKACFKKLKGVSAAKLTALQPVRPILQLNKEDKRFISAYAVADALDDTSNLAAMDWEDFEQLIREVFEKEFSANGGEVKITQASRDGGVDAVAFDPDPIRGGKIIIQAKRYTHTVSVSAVRDLYGTIHNEGANKGILVSTADYGPDAYEFAKGKPITLMSGSELLYLLQKHGHKARIDLQEARLLNAEKEKAQRAGSQ